MRRTIALYFLALAACTADQVRPGDCLETGADNCVEPGMTFLVAVASKLVDPEEVREACGWFAVKGIDLACELVPQAHADIVIVDAAGPCPKEPDAKGETDVLAYAIPGGWIEFYDRCYPAKNKLARLDAIAHELGHQFGMDHVSFDCNDAGQLLIDPRDGSPVCGAASMNPVNSDKVAGLTAPDKKAFELRHRAMFRLGRGTPLPDPSAPKTVEAASVTEP